MPCERDFGRIEEKMKKDRVSKPSEWVSLIKESDHNKPFEVVFVEHPATDDMENDGTPVIKVYDYKAAFDPLMKCPNGISKFRGVLFSRVTMTEDCTDQVSILKRGIWLEQLKEAMMSICPAYVDCLPSKAAKVKDVKAVLQYVGLPPLVTFYGYLKGNDKVEDDVGDFE